MAIVIDIDDVRAFDPTITDDKADAMIPGAIARAALIAPCLLDADFDGIYADAAKSILVSILVRWNQAKPGNVSQETVGPFAVSYSSSKELFWPSELEELQSVCKAYKADGTPLDTAGPSYAFPPTPPYPEDSRPTRVSALVDP